MNNTRMLSLLCLLGGPACGTEAQCIGAACDADGDELYTGEVRLDTLSTGCCDPENDPDCGPYGSWWFDTFFEGTVRTVSLNILRADVGIARWEETHLLKVVDRDPLSWWEERLVTVDAADTTACVPLSSCADRYRPGDSTLFDCADAPDLTFTLRTTARIGEEVDLCYTWGAPDGRDPACEEFLPTW
jgi:hypothetical protein